MTGLLRFALNALALALALALAAAQASSNKQPAPPLQVHIVPHSHDDPGWLKTVDQYYTGANNTIYLAAVEFIFDNVVHQMQLNPDRTYTMCEISFLSRWWAEQTDATKSVVRQMVADKRIAIVNGGWVMHDEASAHFVSMIDQTTLGHEFLKRELGYTPKVGWQIDPFGHSNTHAWFSSEFGFDALYFGRIDYQDHNKRMLERTMEMVWKGSASQKQAAVFTGVFTSGNYGAPQGLCFDRSCVYCRDDPVVDDERLETYNIDAKVDLMVEAIDFEKKHAIGNNVMIKMGADFVYDNAVSWYKSIDLLIAKINAKYPEKYKLFYSTPDKYTEARAAEDKLTWTVKTDDFFPYADCAHCYWSGYFTSRPTLKLLERKSSGFLQALRQSLLTTPADSAKENTELALVAAIGLVNHHDAITGTSKQHVADDYNKILSKALTNAEALLTGQVAGGSGAGFTICRYANESSCPLTQGLSNGATADVVVYNLLPRPESQSVRLYVSEATGVQVQLVNPADGSLSSVPAVVLPVFKGPPPAAATPAADTATASAAAPYVVVFTASTVDALSSKQYRLTVGGSISHAPLAVEEDYTGRAFTITSKQLQVSFSASGHLSHVARLNPDDATAAPIAKADVSNDLRYYVSYGSPGQTGFKHPVADNRSPTLKNIQPNLASAAVDAQESTQASGAYLFRPFPGTGLPHPIRDTTQPDPVSVKVVRGTSAGVTEVRQIFGSWATQIVRIHDGGVAVELEWTVGPIPVNDDNLGKEVVSVFESSLISGKPGANEFFTDANGREFQKRILNYRPTWSLEVNEAIAGNYYPVATGMYLRDEKAGLQLSVLSDRAQAAASLRPGELEFMVHRRLLADDNRGVNEALNETTGGLEGVYPDWTHAGDGITVRGKHWLVLSDAKSGMREVRTLMDKIFAPMVELLGVGGGGGGAVRLGTGLGAALPLNVQLVTLHRLPGAASNTLFLRLAHAFAEGEDAQLSKPVTIDLAALLAPFKPVAKTLTELNLSGNQLQGEMLKNKVQWPTGDEKSSAAGATVPVVVGADGSMLVTLTPMQFRTFTVEMQQ